MLEYIILSSLFSKLSTFSLLSRFLRTCLFEFAFFCHLVLCWAEGMLLNVDTNLFIFRGLIFISREGYKDLSSSGILSPPSFLIFSPNFILCCSRTDTIQSWCRMYLSSLFLSLWQILFPHLFFLFGLQQFLQILQFLFLQFLHFMLLELLLFLVGPFSLVVVTTTGLIPRFIFSGFTISLAVPGSLCFLVSLLLSFFYIFHLTWESSDWVFLNDLSLNGL